MLALVKGVTKTKIKVAEDSLVYLSTPVFPTAGATTSNTVWRRLKATSKQLRLLNV